MLNSLNLARTTKGLKRYKLDFANNHLFKHKDGAVVSGREWARGGGAAAVEHKADVDTKDNDGTTALQVAVGFQ